MSSLADDTRWLDATDQAGLVTAGHVSPAELLEAAIERIEMLDPVLNAVVMRWFDPARATVSDELPPGVFRGVPFLLKDFMAPYAGAPMASGNKRLKEAAVPFAADSTLVSRFRSAGLVVAGRSNTPEFASLPGTEPEAWGPTRNPWNTSLSPGGSSGGSAAAVAAGMVPLAHASDGSGSIRIPASCCGLVGLKPSQGRITHGPLGDETSPAVGLCVSRTVRDTARMLDAVQGPGVGDTVIAPAPARPYAREIGADPGRLRIGLLDHYPSGAPVHTECAAAVRQTAKVLESLGHHIESDFPATLAEPEFGRRMAPAQLADLAAMATRELAPVLGRDVAADDVEAANWERIVRGRSVTGVEYAQAISARAQFRRALQRWWTSFDLLLTPTLGELPLPIGNFAGNDPAGASKRSLRYITFTRPFNSSGQPAINLPLHWTPQGLPVGIQLVAAYGREDILIQVGSQLEQAQPWSHRRPHVTAPDAGS